MTYINSSIKPITAIADRLILHFNMAMVILLVLLASSLTTVRGVICNDDQSLDRDVFEEHGCACGTLASFTTGNLRDLYHQAYEDCHEDDSDIADRYTIDCSYSTRGNDEFFIMNELNRTRLDRLPVGAGDVYKDITCL